MNSKHDNKYRQFIVKQHYKLQKYDILHQTMLQIHYYHRVKFDISSPDKNQSEIFRLVILLSAPKRNRYNNSAFLDLRKLNHMFMLESIR